MPPFAIQPLAYPIALDCVWIVREPVADAHGLPQAVVLEELVPVPADAGCTADRAGIVDEAEDVQRDLWGKRAEEVALEERGDRRGQEEQLGGRAFLDERVEVLTPRGGGEHGEAGDMGDDRRVCWPEGRLAWRWGRCGRRGWDDGHVECVRRRLGRWRGHDGKSKKAGEDRLYAGGLTAGYRWYPGVIQLASDPALATGRTGNRQPGLNGPYVAEPTRPMNGPERRGVYALSRVSYTGSVYAGG